MTKQRIAEFRAVGSQDIGYDIDSVDSYFNELADDYEALRSGQRHAGLSTARSIRMKNFAPVKGGYDVADVDAALDRVEDCFAAMERREFVADHGREAWGAHVERLAVGIMGRLERPSGERFRRPSKRLTKGYFVEDVDRLCDRLMREFKGADEMRPDLIRGAVFRSATGDKCYEETQVDAFLDRCLELIHDLK